MSSREGGRLTRREVLKQGVAAAAGIAGSGLVAADSAFAADSASAANSASAGDSASTAGSASAADSASAANSASAADSASPTGSASAADSASTADSASAADRGPARKPNVILIHTDDQNFEQIACYGHRVFTPHQDRIAGEGVRFTRAYTTTSVCNPSRYACVTGQFPSRCSEPSFLSAFPEGTQTVVSFNTRLQPGAPNIASVLKKAGYTTGMVGKWDMEVGGLWGNAEERGLIPLPKADPWTACESEVDPRDPKVAKILRNNHDRYSAEIKACGFDYAERLCNNPESWGNHPLNVHNLEWVVEGALDFIGQNKDKPFLLCVAPTLHHIPHPQESLLQADPRITLGGYLDRAPDVMPPRDGIVRRVQDAGCAPETAYCTWLDDGVGAILRKLKDLKLDEDTLVILFSDNQTRAKGTLYEGGVRVPGMIRWPRRIRGGRVCDGLAQNVDLAPTVFEACGVPKPPDMRIDGKSLLPMLLGKQEKTHEDLYFEIGWTRAVCTERWKYLALRYPESAKQMEKERGKRLYHQPTLEPLQHNALLEHPNFWDPDQLYDLRIDSTETANFAYDPKHAATLADMKGRLKGRLETFGNHPFGGFLG